MMEKLLEVQVSGKLVHEDYKHFVPEFERLVKQNGKIRVLFEMADFHGWEGAALVGRHQVRPEALFGH